MLGRLAAFGRSLLAQIPTAVVLLTLAGIAYWGHVNDWKAPKFSALGDAALGEKKAEKPGAEETSKAQTTAAAGQSFAWCDKHDLPLSQCTICRPEIAVKTPPPAEPGSTIGPANGGKPDPRTCLTHLQTVEFKSPEAVRKAGIEVGLVREQPLAHTITANGSVAYDQTRLAQLSSRVPGTVWRVEKQVGHAVKKGDVLAVVDAADVGRAKAEFLQSYGQTQLKSKALERMQSASTSLPERQLREAEAALTETRLRLFNAQQALLNLGLPLRVEELAGLPEAELARHIRFLGLPQSLIQSLHPDTATANLIPLTAPFDGVVIGREMVIGEQVAIGQAQFAIADIRRMWLNLDVRLEDAHRLRLGQDVNFRSDAVPDQLARGPIAWISTEADEKTRTVKARASIDNTDGRYRANVFGTGTILVREQPRAIVVPNEALQWDGCCHIVFVRQTEERFQVRKVRPGQRGREATEVLVGLLPGEVVATTGSHLLKSEIFKGRIGSED